MDRLQVICEALETFPGGQRCRGMEGMIEEVRNVLRSIGTQSVVDAAIIAVAQRISHYEIAAYAGAGNYATMLGLDEISDLLAMSLQEEEAVETELTDIANEEVNDRALVGMTESEHLSPLDNFLDPAGRLPTSKGIGTGTGAGFPPTSIGRDEQEWCDSCHIQSRDMLIG